MDRPSAALEQACGREAQAESADRHHARCLTGRVGERELAGHLDRVHCENAVDDELVHRPAAAQCDLALRRSRARQLVYVVHAAIVAAGSYAGKRVGRRAITGARAWTVGRLRYRSVSASCARRAHTTPLRYPASTSLA